MGGEKTRPMWTQTVSTIVILAIIGPVSDGALCPGRCQCNDEDLSAACTSASLEIVPILLNPEIYLLDLSDNKITHLYYTLSIYDNLISLDLSRNKISSLGADKFKSLRNLERLNLSRNEIEILHKDSLNGLKSLTRLDLSFNRIEELHNLTMLELHSVETIILTGNRIIHLEVGLFRTAKHLIELRLDDNQLLEIPSGTLTDALALRHLELSQNLIYTIEEGGMPSLSELKSFSIDNNVIRSIHHAAFTGLPLLDVINLSNNNFTKIPTEALAKLSNLTLLNLSGNFLRNIPPVAFRGLFKLKFLHLNRLDLLEKIDVRAFVDNINLEKIYLNDNIVLDTIPTRLFRGNPRIHYISMKNNRLSSLEAIHFPLDQLRSLHLGGNPFECNCSLLWLWHLTRNPQNIYQNKSSFNSTELLIDSDDIHCSGPVEVNSVLLAHITESEINCSITWIAAVSVVTVLILLLLFGIIGFTLWGPLRKRKPELKDFPTVENRRMTGEPTESTRIEKCMVAPPPSHYDYRNLCSSWDHYGTTDYESCVNSLNIYEQLDSDNTKGRPHIVYV